MLRFDKKIKELAVYGLGTVANSALGLILLPLYMKTFPPSDYGVINIFLLIVTFASMFVSAGMMSALHRQYFVVPIAERKKLSGTTILWYAAMTTFIAVLVLPFRAPLSVLLFKSTSYQSEFLYVLTIVFLTLALDVPLNLLRLERQAGAYVSFSLLRLVSELGLKLVFIVLLRQGIHGYFVSSILSLSLTNTAIFLYLRKSIGLTPSRDHLKVLLKLGVPFIFTGFSIWALNALGRIQLNFMIGQSATGIYSVGQKFSQIFNVAFYRPISLLLPAVMLSGSNADQKVWRRFAKLLTGLVVAGGLVAAMISTLSVDVVRLIMTRGAHSDYRDAIQVIPALTFQNLAYALTIPIGYMALRLEKTNILAYSGIIAAASIAPLNYLLINLVGFSGAAWAGLGCFIEYAVLCYWLVGRHKNVGFRYLRDISQFCVALAVAVLLQRIEFRPIVLSILLKPVLCVAAIMGTAWRVTRLIDRRMVNAVRNLVVKREMAQD